MPVNSPFAIDFAGAAAGLGEVVLAEAPDVEEVEFDVPLEFEALVDVCDCEPLAAETLLFAACLLVEALAVGEL